jgi:tetratricopeptide (TPR) repeat protein
MFAAALQDHQAGRLKEAELRYRQVLACDSRHADSLHLLGVVGCQTGRPALAAEMIGKAIAINAGIAAYHSNLGIALQELGRPDAAIACWHKAIALQPDYPEAHNSLGVALKRQGRLEEAVACYRRAIDLRPQYPQALNNLGSALQEAGRLEEAIACWRRALELGPDLPEAHNNLGNVLMDQGRLEEAVACYRRAIGLRPEQPTAHNHLGSALKDQGRLDESAVAYRRALDLRPDYPEPHNNLGTVLREQGRLDEAAACHRRAIGLRPDYALAHHNLALVLLARGEMAEGWREYEWRWQCPHRRQAWRNFARPQWRGEAAVGRTLLIHAEQGFGDTLQFCRYTPLAAASGLRVIIEAPKPLVRLLRCLDGADRVVEAGTPLPEFDLHCPMLSLPLALGTTLTTIPAGSAWPGRATPPCRPTHAVPCPRRFWRRCSPCRTCTSSACRRAARRCRRISR